MRGALEIASIAISAAAAVVAIVACRIALDLLRDLRRRP